MYASLATATSLMSPADLKSLIPLDEKAARTVVIGRETIRNILHGKDPRLVAIVGPCSIHDPDAALEYAKRLASIHELLADRIFIIMRAYCEKPRTSIGWKGLVNDPALDGSADMKSGLRICRELFVRINTMGLPLAMEMLDPLVNAYHADTASWLAVGARTVESQTHRELASGSVIPVGFKNNTAGSVGVAVNAVASAARSHCYLGINDEGIACVKNSAGNPDCHLILRGSDKGPNCDAATIDHAADQLHRRSLPAALIVDCSHMNSAKDYRRQSEVCENAISLRLKGRAVIKGIMLESNIYASCQPIVSGALKYGVSVTDPCLGWEETAAVLGRSYERYGRV
jgi:3-deoxy-7-phosphoheptulonate synthase